MQAFLIGLGLIALLLFIGIVDEKVSASRRKRKDAIAAARRSSVQRREVEAEEGRRGLKVIPAAPVVEHFTIPPSSSPPPFFDTPFADTSVSCDSGGCDGGGGGCD